MSAKYQNADKLRRWLIDDWPKKAADEGRNADFVLPRDIQQLGPSQFRGQGKYKPLVTLLCEYGWLVKLDPGTLIDGSARKEAYRIERGV